MPELTIDHQSADDGDVLHLRESVREIFELTGLEEALTRCYGCLDEALKASAPAA